MRSFRKICALQLGVLVCLSTPTSVRLSLADSAELGGQCGNIHAEGQLSAAEVAFSRVRGAWANPAYPAAIHYVVVVRYTANGTPVVRHYRGEDDLDGDLKVDLFSEEERSIPTVPSGTELLLAFQGFRSLRLTSPPTDVMGEPYISPLYSFGLRPASNSTAEPAGGSSLTIVGRLQVIRRNYVISCNAEPVGGATVMHLMLRPLRDPGRFRLRQIWFDPDTFKTLRIETQGNFTSGPPLSVPWITSFQVINDSVYIDTEAAQAPLKYAHHVELDDVSISFEQIDGLNKPNFMRSLPQMNNGAEFIEPEEENP